MMDEFIRWPEPYLLCQPTCDGMLSWMIENWMKKPLGKWRVLQHCKYEIPPKNLQAMGNNVGLTF